MSFRKTGARLASSLSTWGLKTLAHRPAANMPGKIALKIDPDIISEEMSKIAEGSIVVVGTNGKTTVTNMIADVIEASGKTVACNRTGANMAYGVAATLLQTEPADWGVFESDELWACAHLAASESHLCGVVEPLPRPARPLRRDRPRTGCHHLRA